MSGLVVAHDCQFAISHIQSKPHPLPLYCANANTGLKIFHCLIPQINPIYVTYSLKNSILMKPISCILKNIPVSFPSLSLHSTYFVPL